ncbi:YdcF family protein [Bartonella tamiae]|uniref:DUF218 domain-containing protein n=1 Tax=Bartonella tamiae Th239 TaxID=1094558 RepID=J1K323_9HYPH|nr:YdcF family protein [Bartonella tamiae]EJF91500.1 hypothetical protein ME5_00195 [Bartonella tamiae Th239]EJF92516.1 hypothetical protein MEG_01686 [Bartonella tamiae Th307]
MDDKDKTAQSLHNHGVRFAKTRKKICHWLKRFFKHLPPIYLFLIFCIVMFIGGFLYFSEKISALQAPDPLVVADSIIVLTGGEKRLDAGLNLLAEGFGKRLLISGVNPATNRPTLIRVTHADPKLFECCVDLGHEALDTIGNAQESAKWLKRYHYKSAYIVTNDYHMPRALVELKRFTPDIALFPFPVNDVQEQDSIIRQFTQLRLTSSEYIKYIRVTLRHFLTMFSF